MSDADVPGPNDPTRARAPQPLDAPPGPNDPTRTRAPGASDDNAGTEPPARNDRLPAPLQYRDPDRYQVIGEHGRGGLGRVLRARDKELGRDVAVKELLERGNTSELRFFREALITARLEHPGIVPVHEAGRWPDGTPFYAMKLVQGRSLRALIDDCKTMEDRLALIPHVIAVADAIAYAHERKIIHRDVKPSNVVVGDFGETVVIDWGLAKDLTAQIPDVVEEGPHCGKPTNQGLTVAGSVLGTPAYMAPEQAAGSDLVDFRADVYSLGAALLHVVTGQSPGSGVASDKYVPREVAAIVRRAMAQSPDDRYATAGDFATDLRAYQVGRRVAAHKYSLPERFQKWVTKNRTVVAVGVVAILGVSTALGVGFGVAVRERDQARNAEARARDRADDLALLRAEALLPVDPTAAYELVRNHPQNEANQPRAAQVAADALGRGVAAYTLSPDIGDIAHIEWPSADTLLLRGTDDQLVEWELGKQARQAQLPLATFSYSSADAHHRWFAYQGADGIVRLRSLQNGHETKLGALHGTPWDLAVSPSGQYVAAAASAGDIELWNSSAKRLQTFLRPPGVYQALRFSPDSTMLAACGRDGRLAAWSVPSGAPVLDGRCDGLANVDYSFTGDGTSLIVGHRSGEIEQLSVANSGQRPDANVSLPIAHGAIAAVTPGSNSSVFIGTETGELLSYDAPSKRVVWRTQLASGVVRATYDKDRDVVIAGCSDGRIAMVTGAGRAVGTLQGHTSRITALSLSEDSRWLASGAADHTVRIWSLPVPAVQSAQVASAQLFSTKFSPDGELVAAEAQDGTVSICTTKTLQCATSVAHGSLASGLSWRHDGTALASTGWDGRLRIWSRASDESKYFRLSEEDGAAYLHGYLSGDQSALFHFRGASWEVRGIAEYRKEPLLVFDPTSSVALSADGTRLAATTPKGTIALWDTSQPTPHMLSELALGPAERFAPSVTLSGSGRFAIAQFSSGTLYFVVASADGNVTSRPIPNLGAGRPQLASFSPDETAVGIGYSDGRIVVMRTATGAQASHRPLVRSADSLWTGNHYLVGLTREGYVWIYDRALDAQCVAHVERESIQGASLSPSEDILAMAGESGRLHFFDIRSCLWQSQLTE